MATKTHLESALLSSCRACLQSTPANQMIPLDEPRAEFEGTVGEFLDSVADAIPPDLLPFLPTSVCAGCYETLEHLFKQRRKIAFVNQFLVGLVQGLFGDRSHLQTLMETDGDRIEQLCAEHGLEYGQEISVDDLLEAFCPITPDEQHTGESEDSEEHDYSERSLVMEDDSSKFETPEEQLQIEIVTDVVEEPTSDSPQPTENVYYESNAQDDGNCDDFEAEITVTSSEENGEHSRGKKTRQEGTARSSKPLQRYACTKCSYKCSYLMAFKLHCQKHIDNENKGGKGFQCPHPYCLRIFDTQELLDQHHASGDHERYVCELCGLKLKHRTTLDIHLERHGGVANFPCSYCSAAFYTQTERQSHLNSVHTVTDRVKCATCGDVFRNRKLLLQHQASHESERKHQCNQCGVSFKSPHYLSRHVRETHADFRFTCTYCGTAYRRKDKLRMHIEKAHLIQTYFVCDICVQSFETEEELQEHREHHANPQPLECGVCLIAFLSQPTYEQHVCLTYLDSYECCGRDFQNHNLYNRHMNMVHGVKVNARVRPKANLLIGQQRALRRKQARAPRSCTICGKVMKTMTEKKNHVCSIDEEMCAVPDVIQQETQEHEQTDDPYEAANDG
ncbi:oocyte zinc finger protein XlCOF6-like [Anopheles aquasalis]|uniref:oocyte zinc finger protein XlCOF6-like n=1 Tax=Anopheles aquasalis TaxID=42839 RepID=UPI00215B510D|nr:oocyte zinc finger protein XlCOF6-like [Anopheles aquasalis]